MKHPSCKRRGSPEQAGEGGLQILTPAHASADRHGHRDTGLFHCWRLSPTIASCAPWVCVFDGEGGIFKVMFVFPSHGVEVRKLY